MAQRRGSINVWWMTAFQCTSSAILDIFRCFPAMRDCLQPDTLWTPGMLVRQDLLPFSFFRHHISSLPDSSSPHSLQSNPQRAIHFLFLIWKYLTLSMFYSWLPYYDLKTLRFYASRILSRRFCRLKKNKKKVGGTFLRMNSSHLLKAEMIAVSAYFK